MRVSVLQVAYDDDAPAAERLERVAASVRDQRGRDLVVLPELWLAGAFRPRGWADAAQPVDGPAVTALSRAAAEAGVVLHAGSIVEDAGGALFNTSIVLGRDGAVLATYRKIHRFGAAGLEPEILSAGSEVVVADLPLGPGAAPVRVGLSTCYDLRFPELYREQVRRGARVAIVPASWPSARVHAWEVLTRARAMEDQVLLVAANAAGTSGSTVMAGRSVVLDPYGRPLAEAGEAEEVLALDVDLGLVDAARADFPVLDDIRLR